MPLYREKARAVEAFPLRDGRYVVATDPPRVISGQEFEEGYELVPDRRAAGERRQEEREGAARRQRPERRRAPRAQPTDGAPEAPKTGREVDPELKQWAKDRLEKDGWSVSRILAELARGRRAMNAELARIHEAERQEAASVEVAA